MFNRSQVRYIEVEVKVSICIGLLVVFEISDLLEAGVWERHHQGDQGAEQEELHG